MRFQISAICSRCSIPHLCSVRVWGNRNPHVLVTFAPKVTPAQRYKFGTSRTPSPTQCVQIISYLPNGRIISAPTRFYISTTVRPIQIFPTDYILPLSIISYSNRHSGMLCLLLYFLNSVYSSILHSRSIFSTSFITCKGCFDCGIADEINGLLVELIPILYGVSFKNFIISISPNLSP